MNEEIITHLKDGIFTVQMNRPEKKNAITQNMYQKMAEALKTADQDNAVRVVVLCGTNDLFTSGNDITDFQARSANRNDVKSFATTGFFQGILGLRKPLIAAVQGYAIGIGTTMLLHCDLVYAGHSATFSLPFVNLGLCPEFGSSLILPRLAGHQRAAELFLLGETFTADHARSIGIVNQVFPDETLLDEVMAIAARLAQKPAVALMATKKLMKDNWAPDLLKAIETDGKMFFELMMGPEAAEAFAAFTENRKPDFSIRQKSSPVDGATVQRVQDLDIKE